MIQYLDFKYLKDSDIQFTAEVTVNLSFNV